MSNNQNRNQNQGNNGQGTPENAGNGQQTQKTTIVGRILKVRDRVMKSRVGRIAVNGLKIAGVGGIAYASYRAGAKSVKPTTVYIREGVVEEAEEPTVETEPEVHEETGEAAE